MRQDTVVKRNIVRDVRSTRRKNMLLDRRLNVDRGTTIDGDRFALD